MTTLPVPAHFDVPQSKKLDMCSTVWHVPYNTRAGEAEQFARRHNIKPSASDRKKITFMLIDNQNTFCLPQGELFVGGRSGNGAVEDSVRITDFIYKNLGSLTRIAPTLDTHTMMQIFHPVFWVNDAGEHPIGGQTLISADDLKTGKWKVNVAVASNLGLNYNSLQSHAVHYVNTLESNGKLALMVWPYHAMLGGIGHALVSAVEEAIFFHGVARNSQANFQIKGGNPLTENYSILEPEVKTQVNGQPLGQKNTRFIQELTNSDMLIIAGQAKSHCVNWSIRNYLDEIVAVDPAMTERVVLLEDCTSAVVVPGVIDFTDDADKAFAEFAQSGMKIRKSTDPIDTY